MALQTLVLDPAAVVYSDDEIVGKVNTASANITRVGSVTSAARPLVSNEVGSSELASGAVGNNELAVSAAKDNLNAMSDTTRGYVQTVPVVGQFPVIAVQRQADGKLATTYDDQAIT